MWSGAIDISLHFHMLLTAAGWPAGQREPNTASLIQTAAQFCAPRGRRFSASSTLINFLTSHSSSFPAVMSSALCPVALLLSKMFDIKMVHCGAERGKHEPLVLHGLGLTWAGVGWAVSPSAAWNDSVSLSHSLHWTQSFSSSLGPAAGQAYGWHVLPGVTPGGWRPFCVGLGSLEKQVVLENSCWMQQEWSVLTHTLNYLLPILTSLLCTPVVCILCAQRR